MSKQTNNSPECESVNEAVAELLTNLSGKECFQGLNLLFAGYLRSDFSNIREDRMQATYTYECFRDFSLCLMSLENETRQGLLNSLKKG